jgi:hypothetical protein
MMVYAIILAVDPLTTFLCWDGVIPVALENARVKWAGEAKLSANAISVTLYSG